MDFLPLADVVSKESAGAAGMVMIALGLITIIKTLVHQRNGKNGKTVATKADVEALFAQYKNPSETEKALRDATRTQVAEMTLLTREMHSWAKEERQEQKEATKEYRDLALEMLRLVREINTGIKRVETSTAKTLELHLPVDKNNVPLWYMPRDWGDKQNRILDELQRLHTKLRRGTG